MSLFTSPSAPGEGRSYLALLVGSLFLGLGAFVALAAIADSINVIALSAGAVGAAVGLGLVGYSLDEKLRIETAARIRHGR